ncbi:MAG TPA: hypothetical protein VFS26_08335, partial [Solirubrobacterales bacterium]|nr:hypothetical protein [Solirubrobacterales bacterium]
MGPSNLQEKLEAAGNPVEMLRNSPIGPYVFPVPAEFSNWRDEQASWKRTAVLFDQSFHMTDVYFEGPDVHRLLSDLGVNSFDGFGPGLAKQFVACNHQGKVIGDSVLFGLAEQRVSLVGRPAVPNWVAYNAEAGDYDV